MVLAALLWVTRAQGEMADFEVYHTAASQVLSGQSPYDAAGTRPFAYMPVIALAMTPFALFQQDAAKFLWFAVSVGLLTAFVRWAVHGLPERRRSDEWLQWVALAVMLPFFTHELIAGQANVLLGTLLVGVLLAVQIDLPRAGAVLLAVAIFIKPYALLLLPWLGFAHGARAALAAGMTLAIGLLLPALVFGWTGNVEMLVAWYQSASESPLGPAHVAESVSVGALWVKWLGVNRLAIFLGLLSVTAILGLVATVWVHRKTVLEPDYLEVALVMLLIPVLSSQSSTWLLLLATPAVVSLIDRWEELTAPWKVTTGLSMAVMSLSAVDLFGPGAQAAVNASGLITVAALGIGVATAQLRWKGLA